MPRSTRGGRPRGMRPGKREANRGSFRPGFDPRRHRFTPGDCRLGYLVTMLGLTERTRDPAVRVWVRMKVSIHNRKKDERKVSRGPAEEKR